MQGTGFLTLIQSPKTTIQLMKRAMSSGKAKKVNLKGHIRANETTMLMPAIETAKTMMLLACACASLA